MAFPSLKPIFQGSLWFNSVRSSVTRMGVPVLVSSLTLSSLILGIRHLGVLQGAELAAYDHFIQAQPDKGRDDRLLIVGIDEVDLQTLQEWPISDRTLANVLKKLEAHQPSVIGIDVLRDIPIEPGRKELLQQLQTSDRAIIVCKVNSAKELGAAPPPGIPLEKVGFADLVIDPGGILRRSLLLVNPPANTGLIIKKHLCNDPENTLISFSFMAALKYLEQRNIEAEFTEAGTLKFGSTVLPPFEPDMGGYQGADAGGYQLLLHYRSESNLAAQVRLTDVLNNKVAPDLIRDRIVFIGYTTPQAKDDFYTPYSANKNDNQKMPGVVVHAQSVSQILGAVLDQQPLIWVWSFPGEVFWIVAWSLVGGVLAWYLRHPLYFGALAIGVGGVIYFISMLIFFRGGWVPFVPAVTVFISTAVGVVLFDRFNNSTYGQNVYKTVKTFLKLEVDIDDTKVEEQVAEITETDYFRDLQDTVKSLREQKNADFCSKPTENNTPTNADDYELNFIESLRQESKRLKEDVASPAQLEEDQKPLPYEKSRLDDHLIRTEEVDEDLNYLDYLHQESQRLKNSKPN